MDWDALRRANKPLNAFIDFDESARGGPGALSGMTVGVKSNIAVLGLPWTAGMERRRSVIAERDAAVVSRLRAAGAVILGTLNMHEAALGATTDNAAFGFTMNPHKLGHTPAGSSGGSGSAVAAGFCDMALGTDTLGSIRLPAAYCGVYGLKPSKGAVEEEGLVYCQPDFDAIGPLTRSLDTLERVWRAMAVEPGRARPLRRILVLDNLGGIDVEPAVLKAFIAACETLDLPVTRFRFPDGSTEIRLAGFVEAGKWLAADLDQSGISRESGISTRLKALLDYCDNAPSRPDILARTRDALLEALGEDGVLLTPTTPQAAFAHGNPVPRSQADFTSPANIAGVPALAIPAGSNEDGLPVSVQLVGPAHSEPSLIALAREIDRKLLAYRAPAQFGF
jgi:aspartyl-tRNA(Asn)/glutamyl-tRNA(Gln) amidotransferase subunit A